MSGVRTCTKAKYDEQSWNVRQGQTGCAERKRGRTPDRRSKARTWLDPRQREQSENVARFQAGCAEPERDTPPDRRSRARVWD